MNVTTRSVCFLLSFLWVFFAWANWRSLTWLKLLCLQHSFLWTSLQFILKWLYAIFNTVLYVYDDSQSITTLLKCLLFHLYHVHDKNKINVAPAKMRSMCILSHLKLHLSLLQNIKIVHNKWTHINICNYQYMAHLN